MGLTQNNYLLLLPKPVEVKFNPPSSSFSYLPDKCYFSICWSWRSYTKAKVKDRNRPRTDEYGLDESWWPYDIRGRMWSKFPDICLIFRSYLHQLVSIYTRVLSAQVSPAARRPVMATADSPGPGTAADLNYFRRSMGGIQSVSQGVSFSMVVFWSASY